MKMRPKRSNAGYSLTELLVAIAVGMFIIAAASATYTVQNRSFIAQEDVDEVNAEARVSLDRLATDIKSAGFGIDDAMRMVQDPVNGRTAILTPTDATTGTDALTIVSGQTEVGTLTAGVNVTDTTFQLTNYATGTLSYPDGAGNCTRCFISLDGVNFARIQSCTDANNDYFCDDGTNFVLDRGITVNLPAGRPVYRVEDISYCVDASGDLKRILRNADLNNCTMTTGGFSEVIAQNVEDLQFAYALATAPTVFVNGDTLSIPDPRQIVTVRVSVLGRSGRMSREVEGLGNPPATLENRNHSATNDSFRRRLWRSVVAPRKES